MTNPAKILIVDDDLQIRDLLSASLAPLGYKISSVSDGTQALERITAERFNLVLLDLMLPGIGGMSILKHIRDQATETEVIVLTAHPLIENTVEALRLGAYDYLTKPFQINTIRSAVKRAIEKQRLETKLAAIYDLSREVALSLNVQQVGKVVIEIAERVLEFEACDLGLIDQERGELYALAEYGAEQSKPRLALSDENGIALAAIHNGEVVYTPDVRDDPRYLKVRASTRSELAIPLKIKERVIGVLNVESDEKDAFSPGDVRLASTLAAQAAVAIENAQLYEQAQREIAKRKKAELVSRQERDRAQKYLDIAGAIIVALDNRGGITLINRRGRQVLGYREKELLGQNWFDTCLPARDRKKARAAFDKLLAGEIEPVEYYENPTLTRSGTERLIAWHNTVLRDKAGKIVGVLTSGEDVTEQRQRDEEIARRNIQLAALNEINQAVNSTLDLKETLTLIANHSTRLMNVEATSVLLYDETKGDLWFAAASGIGTNTILGQRLAMGEGIAGWVAQHGKPALIPTASDDPRVFKGFDREGIFTTSSLLCVPLHNKGKIIGVLEALNKKQGPFDQDDLRLLSALATPAATAIENARLFEQVRSGREQLLALSRHLVDVQEAERGRVARELHDETSQTLASLLLSLSMLEMEANHPQTVRTRAAEMEKMVNEMLDNLHRLAMNLRPASLDILGLTPALEQYVETFGNQYGITTQFAAVGLGDERLAPEIETAIYRIVQEALTNVLRHAQASHIDVLLERRDGQIVTIIEDDGGGFDTQETMPANHLGLFGMQERTKMLGGNLTIESTIGVGTTISAEIPDVRREE